VRHLLELGLDLRPHVARGRDRCGRLLERGAAAAEVVTGELPPRFKRLALDPRM
jgi:hypothetical protein